ncbi:MAG: hypothetical protein ACXAEX_01535 [Promethearchaeota archaeon]|jgi:hypothetical protein
MKIKDHQKLLSEMIEKILFDEKDLENLKELINNVSLGKIDPKSLKTMIINNRVKIMRRILNVFPFYRKRVENQQELDKFSRNENTSTLLKDLEERNNLLQLVGEKIHNIEMKLQKM